MSTLLVRSSGDRMEFLQRSLEPLSMLIFYGELLHFKTHIRTILTLFLTKETRFIRHSHVAILEDYDRQERKLVTIVWVVVLTTFGQILLRAFVKLSPEELELMSQLYSKKRPERLLPVNVWIPYLDTSDYIPYVALWLLETVLIVLLTISLVFSIIQVAISMTPLEGQFKILASYIEQLGRNSRDPYRKFICVEDVILCREESSNRYIPYLRMEDQRLKTSKQIKQIYDDLCTDQCVLFSQELYKYMKDYRAFLQPCKDRTYIPMSIVFILGLYQTAIQKWDDFSISKAYVIVEMLLMVIGISDFIFQCERLQNCQELLRTGIGYAGYDALTPRARRHLCMILIRTSKEEYLKLVGGALVMHKRYFIEFMKGSFGFIKFMRMTMKT